MSIDEAKGVLVTFSDAAFVPPPRTIDDITAILDQQRPANSATVRHKQSLASQPPPSQSDMQALEHFYYRRALAARDVGRAQQELSDLRQAAQLGRQAWRGGQDQMETLWRLAHAEASAGNLSRSVTVTKDAIRVVPEKLKGWHFRFNAHLARLYAAMGDLDAADSAAAEVDRMTFESSRWTNVPPLHQAVNDYDIAVTKAAIFEARGNLARAEDFYRQSIAALQQFGRSRVDQSIDVGDSRARVVQVLARQGRLLEAEVFARASLLDTLQMHGRYTVHTGLVLRGLTRVLLEQGRFSEAETLARAEIDIFERSGASPDSLPLALARDDLGTALVAQEKWRQALDEYAAIQNGMGGSADLPGMVLAGNVGWAIALFQVGSLDESLDRFDAALKRRELTFGPSHRATAEVRGLRAAVLARRGEREKALREFHLAIDSLVDRSRDNDDDEGVSRSARDQRLSAIVASYMSLLIEIRGTPLERQVGDTAAVAFKLADIARGRAVQRALDASAARSAAASRALSELVRGEQDTAKQIGALSGQLVNLLSSPSGEQLAGLENRLRQQIDTLRNARQSLLAQIQKEFPAYGQLINPPTMTVEQVRAALRPGEVLISMFVSDKQTFVWAVPNTGPLAFAVAPVGVRRLTQSVTTLRKALDPSAARLGDIPAFDVAVAYEIYHLLLEPVKTGWESGKSLLIVPHGPLSQLPFALLPSQLTSLAPETGALFSNYRSVPWLIRTHALTVLPSVTSLATLRALPPGDPTRRPFVGFGDPYFSEAQARRAAAREPSAPAVEERMGGIDWRRMPIALRASPKPHGIDPSQLAMLPPLPETADEIRSIALAMSADLSKDVFLGVHANEKIVRSVNLESYRVLVFATHGLVPGDLDGLTQPSLALTAPDVAKVDGDGLLTMEKILGLRLNADWVVLSACNTAGSSGTGSDAISGLGRAFFYAGARALLVSNWPVETTSAKWLTTDLFRRQASNPRQTRAQALQQTQNALIDGPGYVDPKTKQTIYSYAHPIFWAPFTLVGDGG